MQACVGRLFVGLFVLQDGKQEESSMFRYFPDPGRSQALSSPGVDDCEGPVSTLQASAEVAHVLSHSLDPSSAERNLVGHCLVGRKHPCSLMQCQESRKSDGVVLCGAIALVRCSTIFFAAKLHAE